MVTPHIDGAQRSLCSEKQAAVVVKILVAVFYDQGTSRASPAPGGSEGQAVGPNQRGSQTP